MGSSLPMGTSSLGDTEGGRAVDISLPLASAFAVASHAWLSFCSIAFAVHRARLASARWHAPLLRLASSSLPMGTSSLGDTEGGRAVDISLPLASAFAVA